MSNPCDCTSGKQNTQPNSCPDIKKILKRIIIVPKFNAAGTVNEIANVAGITKTALQAKFDANDIDDRWFPLPEFLNVENVRSETIFQEFNDKSKAKIDEGKRSFTGFVINQGGLFLEKLKSWACQQDGFGIYGIDKDSNFHYKTDKATKLKVQPMEIDPTSWECVEVDATDTTVGMIKVTFDFKLSMYDEYRRAIAYEDLDFDGLDTADVYALYTVNGTASSILKTGFTLTLVTDYGLPVKNLLITDFFTAHGGTHSNHWNVTDLAAVPILSFSESSDGVYAFTFASLAVKTIRVTPDKARYDFAAVTTVAIVTPA